MTIDLDPLTARDPFRPGALLFWLWPLPDDPAEVAARCVALGATGVIPQQGTRAPAWCATHGAAFAAAGLDVVVGLGALDAHSIVAALDAPGAAGVMLDWEGHWDGRQAEAARLADAVLAHDPDAAQRTVDCPWWAPRKSPQGHDTHPGAPVREFGRIVRARFVQAYGADMGPQDGNSARMLAWARSPTQYAAEGAWPINFAGEMYGRSVQDHLDLLLQELPTRPVCLWNLGEMDKRGHGECSTALRVWKALKGTGFGGSDALRAFQAAQSLTGEGRVDAETCGALGVPVPTGIAWERPARG